MFFVLQDESGSTIPAQSLLTHIAINVDHTHAAAKKH